MTRVTIITLMQSIARSFPQRQCKQHRQLQEQNKPYVIRYHVCCEVNSYPNSPGPPIFTSPSHLRAPRVAARPAHGVEDHHILLGPAFRRLYHDPLMHEPNWNVRRKPFLANTGRWEMLECSPTAPPSTISHDSVLRICYTRSAARASVTMGVDLMPNNTVDTTAWCHGVVIPQPPSR